MNKKYLEKLAKAYADMVRHVHAQKKLDDFLKKGDSLAG